MSRLGGITIFLSTVSPIGRLRSKCDGTRAETRFRLSAKRASPFNPLAYTDVPETAGLARSINTQPAVRRNSETNPTSQHNRGMY